MGSRRGGGLRRVLTLKNVTHCAVLQDLGLVLVLGDKSPTHLSIWACAIRDLIAAENPEQVELHRITPWNHRTTMFIAGNFHGRNIVVYLRRSTGREYQNLHVRGMVCEVLEANEQMISGHKRPSWFARNVQKDPQWFSQFGTSYADFAYNDEKGSQPLLELCFIDGGWAILTLEDVVICPFSKVRKAFDEARRANYRFLSADSKSKKGNPPPIGITACDDERYLICYPTFGAFVNRRSNFLSSGEEDRVQWIVPAQTVAFHWPYALLFSHEQIEVRNVCTGTLIQVMGGVGTNLRCIWSNPLRLEDGSGIVCISDDSDRTRMFEVQGIAEPPAVQLSAASAHKSRI
ncbi:citron-like protein [Mycena metata]|uniref:Citron-like protein n=1 Tax=Mycena metata TaxID=1033252 RepID=A0AAD7JG87_9AGAR|nr:citron-like protein [Mycena metata]